MTNKDKYRLLCENEPTIPIFSRDWYLDATCGDAWEVCLIEADGQIVASMPYLVKKNKLGLKVISRPQFTQTLGPWTRYDNTSEFKKISQEMVHFDELINQLPKFAYFEQNWHFSKTNWLPFFWRGFSQTTRYTYQIKDISFPEKCYEQFNYAKKKQIKKAEKNLKIRVDLSGSEFYDNLKLTYGKRNLDLFFNRASFLRLYDAVILHDQGTIITVTDENDTIHASLFLIYDEMSTYNLISSIDPDHKSSGASTYVVWEAIKYMSNKTKIFDFEGSMEKGIENSFRQFGTTQVPYFSISKKISKAKQLKFALNAIVKK